MWSSSPAARRTRPSCCSRRRTTSTRTGLANGSDQVGRNYMFHNSQAVLALSREENPTIFQKTLGLNDFYFAQRRASTTRSATSRWSASRRPRCSAARSRRRRELAPQWSLERIATHAIDFWLSTEDLPRPENRVTRRSRRQADACATPDERRAQGAAATRSCGRCSATWTCTRSTCCTASPT